MPCSDLGLPGLRRQCLGVANLIRTLAYPGIRSVKMEELTTRVELLHSICQELTGISYSREGLYISRGAINQHRSPEASNDPHTIFGGWEHWQQDMAHMIIPGSVLDWLEEMDYDVTMLRVQAASSASTNAPSSKAPLLSLADHLRIL